MDTRWTHTRADQVQSFYSVLDNFGDVLDFCLGTSEKSIFLVLAVKDDDKTYDKQGPRRGKWLGGKGGGGGGGGGGRVGQLSP